MEPRFNSEHLIQYAKNTFLGRGFNRIKYSSSKPSSKYRDHLAYPEVENEEVHLDTVHVIQDQSIDFSESATLNNISNRFNASFFLPISSFSLGANAERATENSSEDNTVKFVLTHVHYEGVRCTMPAPNRDKISQPWGDALITAGTLYAGYEIHLHVSIEKNNASDTSRLAPEINAGIGGFNLNAKAEFLNQKLSEHQISGIVANFKSQSGFRTSVSLATITNLSEAIERITQIDQEFVASLSDLNTFEYYIDPNTDLVPYLQLHLPTLLPEESSTNNIQQDLPSGTLLALGDTITKTLTDADKSIFGIPDTKGEELKEEEEEGTRHTQNILNTSAANTDERAIHLGRLFEIMYQILGNTVKESENDLPGEAKRVMAMGQSRIGKSAILGDLLGHPLVLKPIDNGEYRLVYEEKQSNSRRPVIGHKDTSETKGSYLYLSEDSRIACIDCAGVLDTQESPEVDICNAMAVDIMIKRKCPSAILVLIKAKWILEPGMIRFTQTINRLQRILPSDPRAWESVIFILNDMDPILDPKASRKRPKFLNKDEVKELAFEKMQTRIELWEEEIRHLRPKGVVEEAWNTLYEIGRQGFSSLWGDESDTNNNAYTPTPEQEREYRSNFAHNPTEIEEKMNKIALFETLLDHPDNFIVTEYDVEPGVSIRAEVDGILNNRGRLPLSQLAEKFRAESFYEDRTRNIRFKLNTTLRVLVNYFNNIVSMLNEHTLSIETKKRNLKNKKNQIARYNQLTEAGEKLLHSNRDTLDETESKLLEILEKEVDIEKRNDREEALLEKTELNQLINRIRHSSHHLRDFKEEEIEDSERKHRKYEGRGIVKIEEEINQLEKNDSEMFLTTLTSKEPITNRSRWAIFSFLAKHYSFDYDASSHGGAPFVNAKLLRSIDEERGYICNQSENSSKTKYHAEYLPGYCGPDHNDPDISFEIYTCVKDHPDTKSSIQKMQNRIGELNGKITEYEQRLSTVNSNIETAETGYHSNLLDHLRVSLTQHNYDRMVLEKELRDLSASKKGLENILDNYLPFCELVSSLIGIFNLLNSTKDPYTQTQIHKFLINFPEKIFNAHLTANVNELMRTGHRFQIEYQEGLPLGRNALTIETLRSPEPTQNLLHETRATLEEKLSKFRAGVDISTHGSSWRVESNAFLVSKLRRELSCFDQTIEESEEESNENTRQESCIIS